MVLDITKLYPGYRYDFSQYKFLNNTAKNYNGCVGFKSNQAADNVFRKNEINIYHKKLLAEVESIKKALNPVQEVGEKVNLLDKASNHKYLDVTEKALYVLSPIPTVRRVGSIPKNLKDGDWQRPIGMAAMALAAIPGDWREMTMAFRESKNLVNIPKVLKGTACFVKKDYHQHALSFFRGTFLENLTNYEWIGNLDKTLYDTKFGEFIKNAANIKKESTVLKKIGEKVFPAFKFSGKTGQRLLGRTLLRIPLIGLLISAGLEIPAIVKSAMVEGSFMDKVKSVTKQVCKSASFVTIINISMAVAGAAATMVCPPAFAVLASLAGAAVGSTGGIILSKMVNKQIDKAFA